jgi:hypothetical protein
MGIRGAHTNLESAAHVPRNYSNKYLDTRSEMDSARIETHIAPHVPRKLLKQVSGSKVLVMCARKQHGRYRHVVCTTR